MEAAPGPAPAQSSRRFIPVPVDSVDFTTLEMDLYLRYGTAEPALYRSSGLEFTREDLERLVEQGVRFFFIPAEHHGAYRRSLTTRLTRVFKDPELADLERGRIVRESCAKIIEDVLLFAGQGEPVQAVAEVSETFASWCAEDPRAFSYLLDMSSHDFGTAAHMVNVGVGCGLLVHELAPDDRRLLQIAVQGGMLHDIGKRGIPAAILNKEGKLARDEWKLVSAHPMKGFEELRANPIVPPEVLSMVRDHHEHLNGQGYPQGLKGDQVTLPARICAVSDVFDAITAARPYRGATPPTETLRIMAEGRSAQFDPQVLDAFTAMVNRLLDEDPTRAVQDGTGVSARSLADLLQCPAPALLKRPTLPDAGSSSDAHDLMWRKNRPRFQRFSCDLIATGVFHHQGKPLAVRPGEPFPLRVVDLGQGGVQVITPWPVSLGDTMTLELTGKDGSQVRRFVRVVRVRKRGEAWAAGLAFADPAEAAA